MLSRIQQNSIRSVAMESTGVYWIPVYDIVAQAGIDVILVNAYYLKTVPGRKTDVKDCQWIQQLHAYGLLRACKEITAHFSNAKAPAIDRS